ncbi:MAG: glycine C-acetyltransferase [Alphaproteobacteria bacterium]
MSKSDFYNNVNKQISEIKDAGLYKSERTITTPQSAEIIANDKSVICLCANNYLGLANNQKIADSATDVLSKGYFGMASVRFICGTSDKHKELENKISKFLDYEDTILYASCFDANAGLFETILTKEDAIISDELNHASIIDGVRLCKAMRYRYKNNDMASLEENLKQARADGAKTILIATDGVFSMDGFIANLKDICDLADKYDALTMVDDSHAVGFVGNGGRGSIEHCDVMGRVDIMTGTMGKALGGAAGGYTSAKKEVVELLRQRSRPYLFSNSLPPALVAATSTALDIISDGDDLRKQLKSNTEHFRTKMTTLGFELLPGEHPIVPVMLGDAKLASDMADKLMEHGVYVIGFSFPVVPMGKARIRTQMNAELTTEQIDKVVNAFEIVGKELGVI